MINKFLSFRETSEVLADMFSAATAVDVFEIDTRSDLKIMPFAEGLVDLLVETVTCCGIINTDTDLLTEVFMRVAVVMAMALDDGVSVSHAGDVQASLWSGSVFDSDMSVAERDRLMVDLVFFVLDCAVIGFVLNIDMSTDVNAKT